MSTNNSVTLLTYPSIAMSIFDVPEPKSIDGKFTYNYFLPDERESVDTFKTQESFDRHRQKYARQVELSFSPLSAVVPDSAVLTEIELSDSEKSRLLTRYTDKIVRETDFLGDKFLSVKLQDSNVTERILANVEATLLQQKVSTTALSPVESVLTYASTTSDVVDGQLILDSVNVDESNEYATIDPVTGRPFEVSKAGDVSKLTFNLSLSQKFAGDISTNAIKTPLSPAYNSMLKVTNDLKEIQVQSRQKPGAYVIKESDFVQTFDPIQQEKMGLDDVFLGGNTVMGYRIKKYRVDDPEDNDEFFITNTSATSFTDISVMYGKNYNYAISVIYLVRVFGYTRRNVVAADVLVESRESPSINVVCEEAVPPKAPDGLRFYLLQNKKLVLEWDYPVNPTEDIKRFQVFRRSSINEPFEMLCQIDFDNSTVLTPRTEVIPSSLNKKTDVPLTYYCDQTFTLDSHYIYSVCAVDAHDLSSPYSEQFHVSYDYMAAQLVVEFVSEKNAPKPYPNFLLRNQLTEDAIRDSNHSSLSCYFDPEYLKVIDGNKEDVGLLQTSQDEPSYKLQLLHLNFQQSVVANIVVK